MKKFIYQDPRRPRFHSRPIDESDVAARKILEGGGWRVVETIDDGALAVAEVGEVVSVETALAEAPAAGPAEPKKGKGKQAPAAGPAEPKA